MNIFHFDAIIPKYTPHLCIIAIILYIIPLAIYPIGISHDYPNHIAGIFIAHSLKINSFLQEYYYLKIALFPNLALDIAVLPIISYTGAYLAAQIYSIFAVSLLPLGAVLVHRALYGHWSLWPLLSLFAIYNANLTWGFVNCIAGLGLGLVAFAAWLHYADRRTWLLALALLAANFVLLSAHAFGLLSFGFLVLTWEIGKALRMSSSQLFFYLKQQLYLAPSFLLPLAVLLWTALGSDETIDWPQAEGWSYLGGIFVAPFNFGGEVEAGIVAGVLAGALFISLRHSALFVHPSMKFTLVCFALLVLMMPPVIFGIAKVHLRLPPLLFCLFFAASSFQPRKRETVIVVAGLIGIAIVTNQAAAWQTFANNNARQNEMIHSFRQMEPGGRILSAWAFEESNPNLPYTHGASLAVIEASAYEPRLFTGTSVVKILPKFQHMQLHGAPLITPGLLTDAIGRVAPDEANIDTGNRYFYYGWEKNFDYLFWLESTDEKLPKYPFLKEVSRGSFFILYKIEAS